MSTQNQLSNQELFERYLGQPAELPEALRRAVTKAWRGQPVRGYALADLDRSLRLAEQWLVLGDDQLALVWQSALAPEVRSFARASIRSVNLESGLSCRVLRVLAAPDEPPLVELFFTHRQKRGVEALAFVLEQALEGRNLTLGDPDRDYASRVLEPIRAAQALMVSNKLAVVWRLLGYLKPYRKRVVLGTSAAFAITLLSMAPPFVTGHLVDRVIGPVQSGLVPARSMATVAWLSVAAIALV
jgi:ATP-binding cassette, subfamily B, bacterial